MDPSTPWKTHPWVTEGADKLRFGIGLPFWSPSSALEDDWVARQTVDVDRLSDGRLILGIGAGSKYLILAPLVGIDIATLRLLAERVIPELQDYYASIKR